MKLINTLLCLFIAWNIHAKETILEKLAEVNPCWKEQTDLPSLAALSTNHYSDRDWIKLHLSLVQQTLRSRSTSHLSYSQKANRTLALDRLHEYWQQGNFPINDKYSYRTPIFIDDYDNFCAVGYLVKATGYENISRIIAATTNLAYVREMNYPQLNDWANDYGFAIDELAWIQPAYPGGGTRTADAIGKGTNGEVTELYVNGTGDTLFVGGSFTEVDSNIITSGIAYVTESSGVYTWHGLGSGVNGTVNAIQEYQGKLFAGGSFTIAGGTIVNNIAYWDGSGWNNAGCIYGTVKDLIVYKNELYAVGDFDVCAALAEVNFAKWDTTYNIWMQVDGGLTGHVNTIEVVDSALLLGGRFVYQNDTMSIIRWTEMSSYQKYTTTPNIDVMDISKFKDTVYAVGNRLNTTDTISSFTLHGNEWKRLVTSAFFFPSYQIWLNPFSKGYNTFCADNDTVVLGGDFNPPGFPGVFPYFSDLYFSGIRIRIDNAINKMVVFKNELIFGGKFTRGENGSGNGVYYTPLNHIGKKGYLKTNSIKEIKNRTNLNIYPNPISPGATLQIENNIAAKNCLIFDLSGKKVFEITEAKPITSFQIPQLVSGSYLIELINNKNEKQTQQLLIK